jgi:hypothetical protein|tara:strand:- start:544 stop:801 length:258 start_codon:yes stop_codon:yes gene_type:complete
MIKYRDVNLLVKEAFNRRKNLDQESIDKISDGVKHIRNELKETIKVPEIVPVIEKVTEVIPAVQKSKSYNFVTKIAGERALKNNG